MYKWFPTFTPTVVVIIAVYLIKKSYNVDLVDLFS